MVYYLITLVLPVVLLLLLTRERQRRIESSHRTSMWTIVVNGYSARASQVKAYFGVLYESRKLLGSSEILPIGYTNFEYRSKTKYVVEQYAPVWF